MTLPARERPAVLLFDERFLPRLRLRLSGRHHEVAETAGDEFRHRLRGGVEGNAQRLKARKARECGRGELRRPALSHL